MSRTAASSSSAAAKPGVFRKSRSDAPRGFFALEAAGLDWLRQVEQGPPVAEVVEVAEDHLDLIRLEETRPTAQAAREFGRRLALMHDAGASSFGSLPPGSPAQLKHGFFGPLDDALPMPGGEHETFGAFLALERLEPMLALGLERGVFNEKEDAALIRRLCALLRAGCFDDEDGPSRLHGDLWSGNVMWTPGGATLIDPASHGGHRETDVAMLFLFGCPFLEEIVKGYEEMHPLQAQWRERIALHQVYPVGMHAVLFGGGGYTKQMRGLIRTYVEAEGTPPGAFSSGSSSSGGSGRDKKDSAEKA